MSLPERHHGEHLLLLSRTVHTRSVQRITAAINQIPRTILLLLLLILFVLSISI